MSEIDLGVYTVCVFVVLCIGPMVHGVCNNMTVYIWNKKKHYLQDERLECTLHAMGICLNKKKLMYKVLAPSIL